MKVIILTLSVFFAFLTFITSVNAGDIYTYKDKDGVTVISNEPVPEKYNKRAVKIESTPLTSSEIRASAITVYGLDPTGYQDIYEYADDLSPANYKKFVDSNKSKSKELGLSYTTDGTGKITKVISRDKVKRYRQEVKQKKRENEIIQQYVQEEQARRIRAMQSLGTYTAPSYSIPNYDNTDIAPSHSIPNMGAINDQTGQHYAPVVGGVVNQNGTVYHDTGGGYVNTRTGR